MSLADDIDKLAPEPRCRTCAWLADQPDKVREAIRRYANREDRPGWKPLLNLLRQNGLEVSDRAFRDCMTRDQGGKS